MGIFDKFKKNPAGNKPGETSGPEIQLPPGVRMVSREEFDRIKKGQSGADNGADLRKTAVLHFQLAENCRKEGKTIQARNYYLHAVENIRQLAETKKARGDLLLLYECCARLGNSFLEAGEYRNAVPHFEKALSTTVLQILVEPGEYQHSMNAGQCSQMAGFCYLQTQDFRQAHKAYAKGLSLVRSGEDEAGHYFMHSNREHRTFDSYHAEACLQLARIQSEHRIPGEDSTSDLCAECIKVLNTIRHLLEEEDRSYDLAHGVYLCAECLSGSERKEMLDLAMNFCDLFLESAQNRIRFLKLQKEVRKAQG